MYDVSAIRLLGGDLALDFVNSVEDRAAPHADDTLRAPDDLRRWGARLGLVSDDTTAGAPDAEAAELAAAVALREALHDLLEATVERRQPPREATRLLAATLAEAHAAGTLRAAAGRLGWHWSPRALATVRFAVAAAAVELLSGPAADRVRRCANDACGWFFLDATKNAARRWCSMRVCGTRAKNVRRAARRRDPTSP